MCFFLSTTELHFSSMILPNLFFLPSISYLVIWENGTCCCLSQHWKNWYWTNCWTDTWWSPCAIWPCTAALSVHAERYINLLLLRWNYCIFGVCAHNLTTTFSFSPDSRQPATVLAERTDCVFASAPEFQKPACSENSQYLQTSVSRTSNYSVRKINASVFNLKSLNATT